MNGSYGRLGATKDGSAGTAAVGGSGGASKGGQGLQILAQLAQEYGDDIVDIIQSGRNAPTASYPTSSQGNASSGSSSGGSGGGSGGFVWKKGSVVDQFKEQQAQGQGSSPVATLGKTWVPWVVGGIVVLGVGYAMTRRK